MTQGDPIDPIDRFERLLGSIAERPDVRESLRVAREAMRDDPRLADGFTRYVDRLEGIFKEAAAQMVRDSFHKIEGMLLRHNAEAAFAQLPPDEKPFFASGGSFGDPGRAQGGVIRSRDHRGRTVTVRSRRR